MIENSHRFSLVGVLSASLEESVQAVSSGLNTLLGTSPIKIPGDVYVESMKMCNVASLVVEEEAIKREFLEGVERHKTNGERPVG